MNRIGSKRKNEDMWKNATEIKKRETKERMVRRNEV